MPFYKNTGNPTKSEESPSHGYCSSCFFWSKYNGKDSTRGACHFWPPVSRNVNIPEMCEDKLVMVISVDQVYTETKNNDWCGQFKPIDDEEEE